MNKATRKLIEAELNRLEIAQSISRKQAESIDELTEGALFEEIVKNAYTEHPSIQQYDMTVNFLRRLIHAPKTYTKEESMKIIEDTISLVDRLDNLTDVKINDIMLKLFRSSLIVINVNDTLISLWDVKLIDIPEILDQLEDLIDDADERILMNIYNHKEKLYDHLDINTIGGVLDYGRWVIDRKQYRTTLDSMRAEFIAKDYISSSAVHNEMNVPEMLVAVIEFTVLFNTRLRDDIIVKFKEGYDEYTGHDK